MADVKRFNSKNGIENGTQESNLSMSDIFISQHITGDNNDYKLTLAQAQAIPYGVCESLGDEDKTVNLVNYPSTYTAQVGNKVLIKFIHANTKGHVSDNTYPTLTVGGVTKPIAAQGKTIGAGAIVDDQIIELVLTPDYWNIDQNIREVTNDYTILTDGTTIYSKAQTDNTIDTKLESYPTNEEVNTKLENYDNKSEVDSKINGALANYNNYNIIQNIADCNNAYSDKIAFTMYRTTTVTLNKPSLYGMFTILTSTYNDGTYIRVTQFAMENNADDTNTTYQRKGYGTVTSGITWTNWEKLTTESDLLNYLPNLPKSTLTDCDNAPAGLMCNKNVSNAPASTTNYIYLLTVKFDNNDTYQYQICFILNIAVFYTRAKINGSWSSWVTH